MAEDGNATYASSLTSSGYLGEPFELSADEVVLVEESRERGISYVHNTKQTQIPDSVRSTKEEEGAMQSPETWQTLSFT